MDSWTTAGFLGKVPYMATTQDTPQQKKTPVLSPQEENARHVLAISMRLLGLSDQALADRTDYKYQTVQSRRRGWSRIRMGDAVKLATAMDLPVELFSMDPLDAGAWILTNRSEQVIAASRCTEQSPSAVWQFGLR